MRETAYHSVSYNSRSSREVPRAYHVTTAQYMNSMPKEGARMAMAIIIIIPIACCYPFFQKYFISGLTVGAVKG